MPLVVMTRLVLQLLFHVYDVSMIFEFLLLILMVLVLGFMKSYNVGRQEDAHEFLRYFIDAMQAAALFPYKDQKYGVLFI